MKKKPDLCLCSSGKKYQDCCEPFHLGNPVPNAELLMRSRFAAYALNLPEYIIRTTHPASPEYEENLREWRRGISEFSLNSKFERLEIVDFQEKESLATVTFTAHLKQKGKDASFTELSMFEKTKNQWLYRSGRVIESKDPNLMTTKTIQMLPLAYYGDPILEKKADPVGEITPAIRTLVEEMIETMDACDGVGLAAPQVHHSIQLFIIREPIEEEGRSRYSTLGDVYVFINPEISDLSRETWLASEGCLSIPTIYEDVERAKEITVTYTDLTGKRIQKRFSGWMAKVIQHENDHIQGILFINRIPQAKQKVLEPYLARIKNRIHNGSEL